MTLHRRTVLTFGAALAVSPRLAAAAAPSPPALQSYEQETGGRIGLFAQNPATGARIAWRADERFVMCSTFKASLVGLVLSRIDLRQDSLDAMIPYSAADILDYAPAAKANLAKGAMSVADMAQAAVELSDNTCANLLLARVGGPAALTAFWRSIGDAATRLDHTEPLLNRSLPGDPRDTTTPAAMAGTLRRLALGDALSSASRERLTGWLIGCQTGANRLRAGLPASWRIGDKTGNNGMDAGGDLVVAWPPSGGPVLIAAYVQGGTPTAAQIDTVFADTGRLVAARLG